MATPKNIGGLKSLGKATKPSSHIPEYSADPQGGTFATVPRPGKVGGGSAAPIFGKGKKS
jgi:hypothetical protein